VKRALILAIALTSSIMMAQQESFHRAEQDREISYWLLDPSTHQFRISHDFTVTRPGQKSVHSFVRKGSAVSPDAKMFDLDTGKPLKTSTVTGKEVNALGYYPEPVEPDSVVVQGDLERAVGEGQTTRVRVQETYTDPVGYVLKDGELVWTRTLGRPLNYVTLPPGWMLTSVNTPAIIALDEEGRVKLRFTNIRNGDLAIVIKARQRPGKKLRPAVYFHIVGEMPSRSASSSDAYCASHPLLAGNAAPLTTTARLGAHVVGSRILLGSDLMPARGGVKLIDADVPAREDLKRGLNLVLMIELRTGFAKRLKPCGVHKISDSDSVNVVSIFVGFTRVAYFIGIKFSSGGIRLDENRQVNRRVYQHFQ
jgi:hypothetical protein